MSNPRACSQQLQDEIEKTEVKCHRCLATSVNDVPTHHKVALSTANTNKWAILLERGEPTLKSEVINFDYERTGPIRQWQRQLTEAEELLLASKYLWEATAYQLTQEFGISRHTVSKRLKKAGISMRGQM